MAKRKSNLDTMMEKVAPILGKAMPPPGRGYEGVIGEATRQLSKNKNDMVVWPITITSPEECEGQEFTDNSMLITEKNIGFFKGRFEKIGIEPPDSEEDIGRALEECDGLAIRFDVVQKEENLNVFFVERLEDSGDGSGKEKTADEPPEYTRKQLKSLGKSADNNDPDDIDELETLAKANDLDPDDHDTWTGLATALIEKLGL